MIRLLYFPEGDRKSYYFFLQDSWRLANDWELTGGLRYDYFSDFGGTVNPRFALVWQTRQDLTSKLLYGEAFRAPSFQETRNINNPVALGNPDLEPEKIRTVELAFDYFATEDLRLSANVYRYWWSDIIRFVPDREATNRHCAERWRANRIRIGDRGGLAGHSLFQIASVASHK